MKTLLIIIISFFVVFVEARLKPTSQNETKSKESRLETAFTPLELQLCRAAGISSLVSCHLYLSEWEAAQLRDRTKKQKDGEILSELDSSVAK